MQEAIWKVTTSRQICYVLATDAVTAAQRAPGTVHSIQRFASAIKQGVFIDAAEKPVRLQPPHQCVNQLAVDFFGVTLADVKSTSRITPVVRARNVIMFLYREAFGYSYPQVGSMLKKHHTTAVYAVTRIWSLIGSDLEIRRAVQSIWTELEERGYAKRQQPDSYVVHQGAEQ